MNRFAKFVSIVICVSILITGIPVSAANSPSIIDANSEYASYIDSITHDEMKITASSLFSESTDKKQQEKSGSYDIYRDDVYEKTLYINYDKDLLVIAYADGVTSILTLSDYVVVSDTEVTPADYTDIEQTITYGTSSLAASPDYVLNEPFYIDPNSGVQQLLPNADYYGLWGCMGHRTGYINQSTSGYLQRKNDGVVSTYNDNIFTFSPGLAADLIITAATTYYQVPYGDVLATLVSSMVDYHIDHVNQEWSAKFWVNRYQWSYRVRLNSYTGTIVYNTYRSMDYWAAKDMSSSRTGFLDRGSGYYLGYLQSNLDMIAAAVDPK